MGRFYEGNGLGLSIAKGITSLLGGEIGVVYEKGKGSAFSITLPYIKSKPNKIDEILRNTDFIKPKMSIVEDDASNMYLLEMFFKNNLKVKHYNAIDGQEAINMCLKNPEINIVLMDLKLPGIDGYKATGMIKLTIRVLK